MGLNFYEDTDLRQRISRQATT